MRREFPPQCVAAEISAAGNSRSTGSGRGLARQNLGVFAVPVPVEPEPEPFVSLSVGQLVEARSVSLARRRVFPQKTSRSMCFLGRFSPHMTLRFLLVFSIAKADFQTPSTYFSIADSTLVLLSRLTLRFPPLILALPLLL